MRKGQKVDCKGLSKTCSPVLSKFICKRLLHKANCCIAFGIRLRSHTEVCSLQTSPSAPCASSFLQSLDNLASKIVRLLTFATVSTDEG